MVAAPDRAEYQRDLLVSYNNVGDLYRVSGELEKARTAYLHALEITERLVSQDPGNAAWSATFRCLTARLGTCTAFSGN